MDRIEFQNLPNTFLITLPKEFRNLNWGEGFGRIQHILFDQDFESSVIIDASQCKWADPLPVLSLILSVSSISPHLSKTLYLKGQNDDDPEKCKV
ncbi:MAG TPA: hypothetical protein VHS53_14655, partial [Mucilaginibacter sp.]|nr:hypothetical protein [Mucilaginibacter sp.]